MTFRILKEFYFPNVDFTQFDEKTKHNIINEIENDFSVALNGILNYPSVTRFGVYTAYKILY